MHFNFVTKSFYFSHKDTFNLEIFYDKMNKKQYLEFVRQKILQHPFDFSDATLFTEILPINVKVSKDTQELILDIRRCHLLDDLIILFFH